MPFQGLCAETRCIAQTSLRLTGLVVVVVVIAEGIARTTRLHTICCADKSASLRSKKEKEDVRIASLFLAGEQIETLLPN